MNKKAQSSMEYVSTYIYTGLALIIVVGAMTYFGAFNPTTYTKESCESGTQISCLDAEISMEGEIQILLINKLNRDINISNYTIYYEDREFIVQNININIKAKSNGTISYIANDIEFNKGKKESISYEVHYSPKGSTNNYVISGTATTKVEDKLFQMCGNNIKEGTEACDQGDGGSIPSNDYSCETHLLNIGQITEEDLRYNTYTGQVQCTASCTIESSECVEEPTTPCDGCIDREGACVQISEEGYENFANDDLDYCLTAQTWVDCNQGEGIEYCQQGNICNDNICEINPIPQPTIIQQHISASIDKTVDEPPESSDCDSIYYCAYEGLCYNNQEEIDIDMDGDNDYCQINTQTWYDCGTEAGSINYCSSDNTCITNDCECSNGYSVDFTIGIDINLGLNNEETSCCNMNECVYNNQCYATESTSVYENTDVMCYESVWYKRCYSENDCPSQDSRCNTQLSICEEITL